MFSRSAKIALIISAIIVLMDIALIYLFESPDIYRHIFGVYDLLPSILTVFVLLPILATFIIGWAIYLFLKKDWVWKATFILAAFIVAYFILFYYLLARTAPVKVIIT